jgi:hypothetical protein
MESTRDHSRLDPCNPSNGLRRQSEYAQKRPSHSLCIAETDDLCYSFNWFAAALDVATSEISTHALDG